MTALDCAILWACALIAAWLCIGALVAWLFLPALVARRRRCGGERAGTEADDG